jgi:hypothetical protein
METGEATIDRTDPNKAERDVSQWVGRRSDIGNDLETVRLDEGLVVAPPIDEAVNHS